MQWMDAPPCLPILLTTWLDKLLRMQQMCHDFKTATLTISLGNHFVSGVFLSFVLSFPSRTVAVEVPFPNLRSRRS